MQSVLYISYDGITDPLGQSQILPYLFSLSDKGYDIHLLSCEKRKNFNKNIKHLKSLIDKYNIRHYYSFYTKKPPVLSTLKDYRTLKKIAEKIIKENNIKLLHVRSYIPALIALYIKKKYEINFIFDMRGFWADERKEGGIWNIKNPVFSAVYKFFKKKEKAFFVESARIISLTNSGKKVISKSNKFRVDEKKIDVIPCCADFNHFKIHNSNKDIRLKLGIKDDELVLTYLGSVGTWYMLEEMLLFFKSLKKKYKAKFLFLTNEPESYIKKELTKLKMNINDFIITSAKRKDLPLYLSASDIGIAFIKPVFSKKASFATKIGEMLAMGIPLILNDEVGDNKEIIEKYNFGILIENPVKENFEKVINKIDKTRNINKNEIRENAKKILSLEYGLNTYKNVYLELL